VVLSFLNSWGTDGSFGNEDSDRSALSAVGRAIVPVFAPMGIQDDNWPATVGIFTGVFAKEAVVGTLDSLYSGLAEGQGGGASDEGFDLAGGLAEAWATVPRNLAGVVDLVTDPLGIGAVGGDLEGVSAGTFGAMAERFDGRVGAFAYLLFILLYFPCAAALGAVNREVGPRWTLFAAAWTTGIAYAAAVGTYQAATFAAHPGASAMWLIGLMGALAAAIMLMRHLGRQSVRHQPHPVAAE
jgi:ferrous iron transport protein B